MVRISGQTLTISSCLCLVLMVMCLGTTPSQGKRLCGGELNRVLSLVCVNGFSTKVKKSIDPLDFYADSDGSDDLALDLDGWPFLAAAESNALTKTRRRRLGVVNECCLKSCSMSELMSYCRPY